MGLSGPRMQLKKRGAIDKLSETIHIQENGSTCALFFFCKILNSKFLNGLRHSAMCQVILTNLPSTSSFITKEGGPRPFSWLEGAGSLRKGNQLNYQVTFTSAGPQHCLWSQQFWFVELLTPKFHLQNPEHNPPPSLFRRDLEKKIITNKDTV